MTVGTTPRLGLTTWSSDLDQFNRAQFSATIAALDEQCVPDYWDLSANVNNYAASAGSWFFATDTQVHYVGTGASWQPVLRRVDTTVTNATLPAASGGNKGDWYWTSDTLKLYRSNGASMVVIETPASAPSSSPPPVGTIITLLPGASVNAASTTWLPCSGQGVSTSTYATLFALVGYQYGGAGGTFDLPNIKGFQGIGRPSQLAQEGSFTTNTYSYTGGTQNFTIPSQGTWGGTITVTCIGGGGGGHAGSERSVGASVTATFAATAGNVLTVYVGALGGDATSTYPPAAGGWGYGTGGAGGGYSLNDSGGAGGGSSAVVDATTSTLLMVAGAGGGCNEGGGGVGGAGGSPNGQAGANAGGGQATGGGGGTQTGPGAGGTSTTGTNPGSAGSGPNGGAAGNGGANGVGNPNYGGGGGGGGFYGGGGGGDPWQYSAGTGWVTSQGAGGGGGSSYVATATGISYTTASSPANGSVVISYTSISYYTPSSLYSAYIRVA